MQVTVVGAGIAGVACARALTTAGVTVRVLERAHVCGGRMATESYGGRRADTGAGYFTVSSPEFAAVVEGWRAAGLAREWTDTFAVRSRDGWSTTTGPVRWAAAGGLRSLVRQLAEGLDVRTGWEVGHVDPGPRVDGVAADAVVLAMPGPQAVRLLDPALAETARAAGAQVWLPSLVATLRYPERTWDFRGAFVNDHPVLATLLDDGSRRGDGSPVLVAHTTAGFAERFDAEAAGAGIDAAVRELLGLPAALRVDVVRWAFARPDGPGAAPFHFGRERIGLAGDAWGSPKVETAWLSGTRLAAAVLGG
ncbi:NAD(P)/FAD-dependent oxidoreductase [Saccharothrix obliqua]|uniref:NAD(P)/FAD-dependent oxidoreductase n=1 Tax=Saccharothrix obliqua TaxID=2861747 RepID=UPI001C5FE2B7|nr:FAD-dependent oxidoreductase [Saccharothrix obliqua]MBW4717505.1 FAD-dependent oxidoreductase [Saccharothrix obliqua]